MVARCCRPPRRRNICATWQMLPMAVEMPGVTEKWDFWTMPRSFEVLLGMILGMPEVLPEVW